MPRAKGRSHINGTIDAIVARVASEIAAAVRADVARQVSGIIGPERVRKIGRGRKPGPDPGPLRKAASKFQRRTPRQIAAASDKLVAYIKAHPGQRSEQIQKGLGMAKPALASGLQRLRDAGRVRMKGIKRAATYSVA
jgi:hypothetical protein